MRSKCLLPWGLRGIGPAAIVSLLMIAMSLSAAIGGHKIELGRQLFEHKWVPDDPLCPDGDGLGPLHNADSCVACHNLGATGGAGSCEHNVALMTLVVSDGGRKSDKKSAALQAKAEKIHPAFGAVSTVMLHQFGTDPRYERWRLSVLGLKLPPVLDSKKADDVRRAAAEMKSGGPLAPT